MKNWQQRWFVLRGDQLFYYKDKDETKPQVRGTCSVVLTGGGGCYSGAVSLGNLFPGWGGTERPSLLNHSPL